MHRFRKLYPGINLHLSIGNTEQVAAWGNEITVDLGLVEGEVDNPMLSINPIANDDLVLVASPQHVWAMADKITPEDLVATPWVLREAGSATRAILEGVLTRYGFSISDCTIALELPSNEAVLTAVEDGAGATIVSEVAARARIKAGSLLSRDIGLPKRLFYSLRHKERSLTGAQRAFLGLVTQDIGDAPAAAE